MRRRAIGLGLVGLAAFALAAALVVRLILVDTLVKLPLDQTASAVAAGTDVDFFDAGALKQRRGMTMDVEQRVQGDAEAEEAGDDVAVWNFGSTMFEEGDVGGEVLNAYTYRVCLDRHTAVSVECEADSVDDDKSKTVEGLTLTFPFGTEQRDYELFNPTTAKAWPATFEGVEDLDGLEVYKFETVVPETVIRTTDVPGDLVGSDEDSVPAEVVYSNTRTMWVEPTSGVIVTAEEDPNTVLRGPDGEQGPTVLAGHFAGTEQTVTDGVARAEDTAKKINLVTNVLPLVLLILGLVALTVGVLLALSGRGEGRHSEEAAAADAERQPVQAH